MITSAYLKSLNACSQQVQIFEKTFPEGTTITQRSCKKAVLAGLDLCWLAAKLFDAPAYKQYNKATAPAQKQFNEATAPAYKQFAETTAPAQKQYDEATATARKQYKEASAVIFYNIWKKGNK